MKHFGFNPQARWDRHIPETDSSPALERYDEPIEVVASFKNGSIHPRCFIWNQKEYSVERTTYHWQERQGQSLICYFSVSCQEGLYQISFNNSSFTWRLDKIIA